MPNKRRKSEQVAEEFLKLQTQNAVQFITEYMEANPQVVPVIQSMCQSGTLLQKPVEPPPDSDELPRSYIKMRNLPVKFMCRCITGEAGERDIRDFIRTPQDIRHMFFWIHGVQPDTPIKTNMYSHERRTPGANPTMGDIACRLLIH